MRSAIRHLVLTLLMVMNSFADKSFLPGTLFLDDNGIISDLLFASIDSSLANGDEIFENDVTPDVSHDMSPDISFGSADSSTLDYFQLDDHSEFWDEAPATLQEAVQNPECISGESQLPTRLRARTGTGTGTCTSTYTKEPPTVFDLSDPNLKLKPVCPMAAFPMLPIAVCSSGNPLDEWGPLNNFLLYDSERGELM